MSTSAILQLSIDSNGHSMNTSTTFSYSMQVPSITNNISHSAQYSGSQDSPVSSYTKSSKLALKINLSSKSSQTLMKGEQEVLKHSHTPITPAEEDELDHKNYTVKIHPHQTPTPKMKRNTPSVEAQNATAKDGDFPATEPVLDALNEVNEDAVNDERGDKLLDIEQKEALQTQTSQTSESTQTSQSTQTSVTEETSDESNEDEDEEEDDETDDPEVIVRSEEEVEQELLGRFGYTKTKVITKTLQGNIFVATLKRKDGNNNNGKKDKEVVIKKTSKQLHSEHVTVQNGKKFGIYENILKECIILKHLTENRNGLIMTSFTKYDNFFDDEYNYYLSMEHGGSDLFDFIIEAHELINDKKLKIKEWRKFTKYLFWQMIVVIKWLHNDMNICHLDISLENILIKNGNFIPLDKNKTQFTINSNVQIKICDFGLAEIFNGNNNFKCTKFCGKTNYKAPEVYGKKGVFDARKADVWSLGVVLFCMLVGSPPYNKPIDSDQAYLYIKNGIIDQLLFQWERNHFITVKVLSLLHKMLNYDVNKRFFVDDVIKHPWLSLYFHKYKNQMAKKSQLQQQKNKRIKPRLPFYKLPQNTLINNISQ